MEETIFKFYSVPTPEYEALATFLNDCGVGYELHANRTNIESGDEDSIIIINDEYDLIDSDYVFDEIGVVIRRLVPASFDLVD